MLLYIIEDKKHFFKEFVLFLNKLHKTDTYYVKKVERKVKDYHYRDDSYSTNYYNFYIILNNYTEVLAVEEDDFLYCPLNYAEYEKFNMDYFIMFDDATEKEKLAHKEKLEKWYEETIDSKMLKLGDEKEIQQFAFNYIERKKSFKLTDEMFK